MSFRKGVIWLLLAIVVGAVPTVSPASFFIHTLLFLFYVKVFMFLDLNGTFCSLLTMNENY